MAETSFIPVNTPLLAGNELKYLTQCIETGWISSEGSFVKEFEAAMAASVSRKHAYAVANGTVALDAAVQALEIGPGDEVIIPTFTIISCASAVVKAGATPVLVDADPQTWNTPPEAILEKITPRTKAIMIVHIYGLPVDMDPVLKVAEEKGIAIIEDAAEMIGQTYKGRLCGGFGDISTFSFYPNKHVTTGEGGMVLTNNERLAERTGLIRNLFFTRGQRFHHEELGSNMRMTNLQAAVGLAQFEQLDSMLEKKRAIGKRYDEAFAGISGITTNLPSTDYADNIYWVYGIVLGPEYEFEALDMMKRLGAEGIGTRPFFWCMHEQNVFKKMNLFAGEEYPVAENMARRGFYIPSGLGMSADEQDRVCEIVGNMLQEG